MRLSTDPDRDDARSVATLRAALAAGARTLDTARAYGLDDKDAGHNERLISRVLADGSIEATSVRVVTKCGMRRPDGDWRPDGRAGTIASDARASREALGRPADVLLLHAPDPAVSFATSVRALARAAEDGHARSIGLSNVTRGQLDEALAIAPIAAVEIALGAFDDESARGGVVARCIERGIEILAHSPLGGPKRAPRLAQDAVLVSIARGLAVTAVEVVLAYLCKLHPSIVALVGARTPETAVRAIAASSIALDDAALAHLDARFPALAAVRRPSTTKPLPSSTPTTRTDVVLLMGISGAGKTRATAAYVDRGYVRWNRDSIGGSLRGIVQRLEGSLASGAHGVVLDNTYLTRATRNDVIVASARHGARVRCVHFDTPIHDAQTNVVLRMLEKYGALLGPDEIARHAKKDPNLVRPTVLFRMARELEPPSMDEGFTEIDTVPFVRSPRASAERAGAMFALDALVCDEALAPRADAEAIVTAAAPEGAPCLVFAWRPDADDAWLASARAFAARLGDRTRRSIDFDVCVHAGGPPVCWCRPPLPGLWLAFAERHRVDASKSVLVGASAAHSTMARALGLTTR